MVPKTNKPSADITREPAGFQPAWVSPPGETMADLLRARGLNVAEFAEAIMMTPDDAAALLDGRVRITIALARQLAKILGASVQFWMSREHAYRQGARRFQAEHGQWLEALPMRDMIRYGWISPRPRAAEEGVAALRFFGLPSVEAWHTTYAPIERLASFRTSDSFESLPGAVAAWLREGERRAAAEPCAGWDPARFREALADIRALTRIGDPTRFLPLLRARCAAAGVAVVALRGPTGCRASGAARFVAPDRALLLLSARHLVDDQLWFTFFHEGGHLLLHDGTQVFVDEETGTGATDGGDLFSVQEREADAFATDTLIPPAAQPRLRILRADAETILRFASELGIAPGIVVGQLQHLRRLRPNQLNSLKHRFAWADDGTTLVRRPRQPRKGR
jgi:plasmid maintenance system antidote protein VapI